MSNEMLYPLMKMTAMVAAEVNRTNKLQESNKNQVMKNLLKSLQEAWPHYQTPVGRPEKMDKMLDLYLKDQMWKGSGQ